MMMRVPEAVNCRDYIILAALANTLCTNNLTNHLSGYTVEVQQVQYRFSRQCQFRLAAKQESCYYQLVLQHIHTLHRGHDSPTNSV